MSQAELAERINLTSQGFISRLENETASCSFDTLNALSLALGVPASWLCGEDSGPSVRLQAIDPEILVSAPDSPAGLVALATDERLATALAITSREWAALRSLQPPAPLPKEGYLAVLLLLRAYVA